jgi:hypothetical protein
MIMLEITIRKNSENVDGLTDETLKLSCDTSEIIHLVCR